ncbi:MAG: hypothetical protein GKR89_07605 [Candidatus Latescibacteria bacterium]|nr:hypothetical protein [Candidatus Latescibacterota bacterium]
MNKKAEALRKQYLYRRLVLSGKVDLPQSVAARLVGPDCAYHLYRKRGAAQQKPGSNRR